MSKVLILCYYWPPAGGPGVQRWLYFSRYLREFGIDPVLYVPENPHYPIQDPQLGELVPDDLTVYRSRFWEPYALAALFGRKKTARISSGIIGRENPGRMERLFLWIRGNLFIPDARKCWIKRASSELPGILEKEAIKTVITTGPPHSVHLIGMEMKRRFGLKWLADFRDPWTEIGYHDALRLGSRAKRRHKALEKQVLTTADTVLATSSRTAASFEAISGRPVKVITNGYDGPPASGEQPEGPFTLAHIGSLLSGRNPEALWAAIARRRREDADFQANFQLELTGVISTEIEDALRGNGLWDCTRISGYVSHEEALRRQRSAQVLLLIEINRPETRGILPGKFFEYLAAGRPILAIGPAGWEAAERLKVAGGGKGFTYSDESAIYDTLGEWFASYKKGRLVQNATGVASYSRRALTEQLATLLWES